MIAYTIRAFIYALLDDTKAGILEWHYMDEFTDAFSQHCKSSEDSLPFPGLLETEFMEIDYHRSYACMTNAGIVYLYYCLELPGSEDSPQRGERLSVLPMPYDPDSCFEVESFTEVLYRLENAIRKQMSESNPYWAQDLLHYLVLYNSNQERHPHDFDEEPDE